MIDECSVVRGHTVAGYDAGGGGVGTLAASPPGYLICHERRGRESKLECVDSTSLSNSVFGQLVWLFPGAAWGVHQ